MLTTIPLGAVGTIGALGQPHPHRRLVSGAAQWLSGWAERRRQLRALSELDEHLLRDVGLCREDVRRACSQTFWMY
jgi:uncharacterized protein YjiS (DUF1127 family)